MLPTLTYPERANYCLSTVARRLLNLINDKQTNLALSADVTSSSELLTLAKALGPEICVLKTHIDIIEDYTPALSLELRKIAHHHHFLIFEDRKFADIGNTVKHQYEGGIYQMVEWADLINAHSLPGPGIVQGLAEAGRKKNRGLILIAEMSSQGHLMNREYIQHTLQMAEHYADFVIGFITQHALSPDPHWINFTPGIKLESGQDRLGQQYLTPETAILDHGSDVIIVGRGIISAVDSLTEAKKFRSRGWDAYMQRIES